MKHLLCAHAVSTQDSKANGTHTVLVFIYNTYYVPGTEHPLLLYGATVLDRSYYYHPISQMRKLRLRAFNNLYNSKPLVKG